MWGPGGREYLGPACAPADMWERGVRGIRRSQSALVVLGELGVVP